ncbi:hypothetical protein PVAND_014896 [Polypedilum vanderplanki]|uniref:HTH CENPB-type domain-containing protein n=1 Tax=Polypedilum vanderplanki TaxID=319348 RepID=A0A9J6BAI7_POLVA|nr:hypothetical protein PVAND_014896 [Polypedilum vanderplanki]
MKAKADNYKSSFKFITKMPPTKRNISSDPLESSTSIKIIDIKQEFNDGDVVMESFENYDENEDTEQDEFDNDEYEYEEMPEQNVNNEQQPQRKKRKRDKYLKYSREDLNKASFLVLNGKMTIFKASKIFSIPKTTLHYFVKNLRENKPIKKRGIDATLTESEEEEILEWAKAASDFGVYRMREDIVQAAADILKLNQRPGFRHELPSNAWSTRFISKHSKNLHIRKPHESVDEAIFFTKFYKFLSKNNLLDVLDRPDAFYVMEDTNFELSSVINNSINRNALRKALKRKGGDPKEIRMKDSVTVTYCFGADGRKLQELVIFNEDFKDIVQVALVDQELQSKFLFTRTKTGGHTRDSFKCYLQRLDAQLKDVQRPIFIFCSETLPQVSLDLYRWCRGREIFIISFIPFEICILELCDKEFFGLDNFEWRKEIERISENKKINEIDFIRLLKKNNDRIFDDKIIFEIFNSIGIFPFDTNRIIENFEEPEEETSIEIVEKPKVETPKSKDRAIMLHLIKMKKMNEQLREILKVKDLENIMKLSYNIDKQIDEIKAAI